MGRCKTYMFASLWKIGLTFAFVYILIPDMTPMADIFRLLGNETVYASNKNETSLVENRVDFTMKFPNSVTLKNEPSEENITYDIMSTGRYQVPTVPTPGMFIIFTFSIIQYILKGPSMCYFSK